MRISLVALMITTCNPWTLLITLSASIAVSVKQQSGVSVRILRHVRRQWALLSFHSVCLSVGHSATYSLPRLIDHNQIWYAGTFKRLVKQAMNSKQSEVIQRWSAICRVWPWTLTYQKFLLCISSQGQDLYSHQKLNTYIYWFSSAESGYRRRRRRQRLTPQYHH